PAGTPYLLELRARGRPAPGDLHQRGIAEDALHRPILARRGALAPEHQLARHRPRARAQSAHAWQALKDRLWVALVARALQYLALLSRPLQAPEREQAPLELGRQLEQVHHILARIRALLGGQRSRVPACERGGLCDPHSEQLRQERLVGALRPESRKASCDLRV